MVQKNTNKTTDFYKVRSISKVNVICQGNCSFPETKLIPFHGNCNETILDKITIASLSQKSSKDILNIFKTNSFCFPTFNARLLDDDTTIKDFIATLRIAIKDTYNPVANSTSKFYD